MRNLILPYKATSSSAKALADAMGIKRIKLEGSRVEPSTTRLVNWGNSRFNTAGFYGVINQPVAVASAANKARCFQLLSEADVVVPPFTTDQAVAQNWLSEGKVVVVRHKLAGHSGDGIELVDPSVEGATIPAAPLYTMYVKKRDEYRVHVMSGVVTDVQRKARDTSIPDDQVDWKIRNHGNGFNFIRKDVEANDQIKEQAIKAVAAVGLDFGAVDIIWNQRNQVSTVLEINTACGLEGTTLERYQINLQRMFMGLPPREYEVVREAEVAVATETTNPYVDSGFSYEVIQAFHVGEGGDTDFTAEDFPAGTRAFVSRFEETDNGLSFTDGMVRTRTGRVIEVEGGFGLRVRCGRYSYLPEWLIPLSVLEEAQARHVPTQSEVYVPRELFYVNSEGDTDFTINDFNDGDEVMLSRTSPSSLEPDLDDDMIPRLGGILTILQGDGQWVEVEAVSGATWWCRPEWLVPVSAFDEAVALIAQQQASTQNTAQRAEQPRRQRAPGPF